MEAEDLRKEMAGKKLFTPGPLCVSETVRLALLRDLGSRDEEFISIVRSLRSKLLQVGKFPPDQYTTVLVQGSGTFGVEAVLQSCEKERRKVLILASGAYGRRMGEICSKVGVPFLLIHFPENERVDLGRVEHALDTAGPEGFSAVAVVHCETTSGVLNDIAGLGRLVRKKAPSAWYIVDAMSSFGGVDCEYENVDFLVSSANKCLQGVPGFSFVIADKQKLLESKDRSRSLSLDLYHQWTGLESNGQFRFTPPTHAILALNQALKELDQEGGVRGREKRYKENNALIKSGVGALGFSCFVSEEDDGHIITSFKYPSDPHFNFDEFYRRLSEKDQLIYPGKVTSADCFRIGNIGHLFPADCAHLVRCIEQVLRDMKVSIPLQ